MEVFYNIYQQQLPSFINLSRSHLTQRYSTSFQSFIQNGIQKKKNVKNQSSRHISHTKAPF